MSLVTFVKTIRISIFVSLFFLQVHRFKFLNFTIDVLTSYIQFIFDAAIYIPVFFLLRYIFLNFRSRLLAINELVKSEPANMKFYFAWKVIYIISHNFSAIS